MIWLLLATRLHQPLHARKKNLDTDWYDLSEETVEAKTGEVGEVGELELSRRFDIRPLIGSRRQVESILTPTPTELEKISKRLSVEVHDFTSNIRLIGGDDVVLQGDLTASLTQNCVITTRPVTSNITATFEIRIAEEDDDGLDDVITFDEVPLERGRRMLDVGELAVQYLSLEIDPYPRAIPYSDGPIRLDNP